MKFSVVIPVYNVEEYLEDCIKSVLNQTYPCYEIILVDDGSVDRSGELCDHFAEIYPETIKVIHNENQGQMRARLSGVRNASGDVCMFVDSDDFIRTDSLALLHEKFSNTHCDIVLFNATNSADFVGQEYDFKFHDGQCFEGQTKNELYALIITTSCLNSVCMKAVRMSLLRELSGNVENFRGKNAEDLLLSLFLVSNAQKICYLNQNLYYYRKRPGSIVHTYNPERHRSIKKVHMEMEKYIDEWGMQELHAMHYAREVRGWVECLWQLMKNVKNGSKQILHELAEDSYFRNAYENMDHRALSKKEILLSRWLYQKKYGMIKMAGVLLRAARKLKSKIKR